MNLSEILKMVDHTLLRSTATQEDVRKHCVEGIQYGFATVCVHGCYVALCNEVLQRTLPIASVAGFPYGTNNTLSKAHEAALAVREGASEIDMVISLGAVKDRRWEDCVRDIRAVVDATDGRTVKVIIETCLLTEDEKKWACEAVVKGGAHFVKTSTGFAGEGATVEDVKLMRSIVGPDFGVKAAGGVRTLEQCIQMIQAGANRIGTGTAVKIAQGTLPNANDIY